MKTNQKKWHDNGGWVVWVVLLVLLCGLGAAVYGYVVNIQMLFMCGFKLCNQDLIIPIMRIIGVVIFPLGIILGFI